MATCVAMAFCLLAGSGIEARADIVIGVAVPTSGPKAAYGATLVSAARADAETINEAGGLDGQPLTIVVADDDCSGPGGAAAAAKLIERTVDLVIGHPCSNAALSAAKIYAAANIWFVAIGARHPDLTAKRTARSFRLGGTDGAQARETAALLLQAGWRRFAIVQDRTAYARGLASGVAAEMGTSPGVEVSVHAIVAGEKDYASVVAPIVATAVDAVYFAGFPIEGALILQQLRAAGSQANFVGSDALDDPAFVETAGSATRGAFIVATALEADGGALVRLAISAFAGARRADASQASTTFEAELASGPSFQLRTLWPAKTIR
jgi:branched-chain amino acid transport system substrate-binding protein